MKKFSKLLLATTLVAALLMMIWGGTAGSAKAAKIDYRKPSENKPYPDVQKNPGMWIHVNLKKQRVYLMSNKNKKLYTMYCSSGAHNATPTGTYHIEDVRGGIPSTTKRKRREPTTTWLGRKTTSSSTLFQLTIRGNTTRSRLPT